MPKRDSHWLKNTSPDKLAGDKGKQSSSFQREQSRTPDNQGVHVAEVQFGWLCSWVAMSSVARLAKLHQLRQHQPHRWHAHSSTADCFTEKAIRAIANHLPGILRLNLGRLLPEHFADGLKHHFTPKSSFGGMAEQSSL